MINAPAMAAGLARSVSGLFGGPYVDGRVIDQAGDDFDEGGSIAEDAGEPITRSCSLMVDTCTEGMRTSDGYAEGDVGFFILTETLDGPLDTDATVEVLKGPYTGAWLVSGIAGDPASIHWQGRGRRAP